MRLPTASKVGLSLACSYPWSSQAPRIPFEPQSASAELGTAVHAVCERLVRGEDVDLSALSTEVANLVRGAKLAIESIGLDGCRAEIPLAYDPTTGKGRELPAGEHRAYDTRRPTEIVGTADVLAPALVYDFKTGRGARETRPRDSWQLRTLALAAARAYGWTSVRVGFVHLSEGDFWLDDATLDAWDLDETADEIARLVTEIRTDTSSPRPGSHCYEQWCPIRAVCPTTRAALERIDADAAAFIPAGFSVANDDDARKARVVLRLVDDARAKLESELKAYVRRVGSVSLGDGRAYGVREQTRETISLTQEAANLLVSEGAANALEIGTSKAAIQRALAETRTGRGEAKRATEAVVAALRDMGCVRSTTYEKLEEFAEKEAV